MRAMAREAIDQYNRETAAGGEPPYPAWADDMLAVCDLAVPPAVLEALKLWTGAEPSQSLLARAVDEWQGQEAAAAPEFPVTGPGPSSTAVDEIGRAHV